MYTITDQNIDYILEDLGKRGINTESMRLNLLDHICILIEENLEENGDFEQFYATTIRKFYTNELSELENEAICYLSSQNNFIMKKAMIGSGIFSATAFIVGSLSKIMSLQITDFILFLGFTGFVLLFLPLVLIVLIKEIKSKNEILMYISGTISLLLYFVCMLLKCLSWPASALSLGNIWLAMWLASLAIGGFVFIPTYLISGMRKPATKTSSMITAILLVAFIGVQFRLTNIKPIRQMIQQSSVKSQRLQENGNQLAVSINK